MEFFKVIFFISLCIIRFSTANDGTMDNKQGGENSQQAFNVILKATTVAPTEGSLNNGGIHTTQETPNLDSTTALKSMKKPKGTIKSMLKKASRNRRWNTTKKSIKSRIVQSGRGLAIKNSTSYASKNTASGKTSFLNRSYLSHSKKIHPCNTIQTSAMNYSVGGIMCRRRKNSELQHRMSCSGSYNHRYLASSFKEAQHFKDLDTGRVQDLSASYIWHRSNRRVQKRTINVNPGETLISQCHPRKSPTESGHLRICPTCAAITRQPATPRRFPEYINELLCDPQMASNYLPGIDGFCVQKTFTLDLLQFTGDWDLDLTMSAQTGLNVYQEKWEMYTQTIRRHCACELLASSPIADFL